MKSLTHTRNKKPAEVFEKQIEDDDEAKVAEVEKMSDCGDEPKITKIATNTNLNLLLISQLYKPYLSG